MTRTTTAAHPEASAADKRPRAAALSPTEITRVADRLEDKGPEEVIEWALERFGDGVAVVTSFQADGMAILDMAYRIDPTVQVITIDTGRLPTETLEYIDAVRNRYPSLRLMVEHPDGDQVDEMVGRYGPDLFREAISLRTHCCDIRKVRPLGRALKGFDAWFTGLRRDHSETRSAIRKVERDEGHGGIAKINPLADWDKTQVNDYLEAHGVPLHPLYAQGYTSLGCAPCTRPIGPGEDERAGRWWWEVDAPKECGMHYPADIQR